LNLLVLKNDASFGIRYGSSRRRELLTHLVQDFQGIPDYYGRGRGG